MNTNIPNNSSALMAKIMPINKNGGKTHWFTGLNSLRFVLAFVVFLSHCPDPFVKNMVESKILIVKYTGAVLGVSFVGIAAVIAFFIISGFVIHYSNKDGVTSIKDFYLRRGARVLFPLVVIKIVGIPLNNPENVVVWSLYCELIYYAVYPFLAMVKKISWRSKTIVAFLISITIIFLFAGDDIRSMIAHANIRYNGNYPQFGNVLNWLVGLPCWLLGVDLANKADNLNKKISFKKILTYRLGIFVLTVVCCALRFHFFVSYAISMTLIAIPICKWIEAEICYYQVNSAVPYLEQWGKFSYSLYLCHPLLVALLLTVMPLNERSYFFYILLTCVVSYFFYLLLEKPAHIFAKKISTQ